MFKIIKETELKDGGVQWEYEVTAEFKKLTKTYYNKKKFTDKLGAKLILDSIFNAQRSDLEKQYQNTLKINGLK